MYFEIITNFPLLYNISSQIDPLTALAPQPKMPRTNLCGAFRLLFKAVKDDLKQILFSVTLFRRKGNYLYSIIKF